MGVQAQRVEAEAGRDEADGQVERDAAAARGEVEGGAEVDAGVRDAAAFVGRAGGVDAAFAQPRDEYRGAGGIEQGRAWAAGNVSAEADMQALGQRLAQRKNGVGEIGVGGGAMGDPRAARFHERPVLGREMDGMGEHRAAAEQGEAVEARGVRHTVAGEDVGVFPVAFGDMGLDGAAAFGGEPPEAFERGVGAGGDEARRDDGRHPAGVVSGMSAHIVDEGARLGNGGLRRRVAVRVRAERGMVHRDAADQGALAFRQTDIGERARGVLMDGREVKRRRRAMGEQVFDEGRVGGSREGEVGVTGFERESVFVEPNFQGFVERGAELRILRRMDVAIDEAGKQIGAGRPFDEAAVAARGVERIVVAGIGRAQRRGYDPLGVDGHGEAGQDLDTVGSGSVEGVGEEQAVREVGHGLSRRRAATPVAPQ